MIRFVLHPGPRISSNDGDLHYITAPMLAQLYGVRMSECIVVDRQRPETVLGQRDLSQYLHLYPARDYQMVTEFERAQWPKVSS